jgi:hypothetical protein
VHGRVLYRIMKDLLDIPIALQLLVSPRCKAWGGGGVDKITLFR